MRARHILAIAVLGIVASVAAYQAVTASPPQPYVRLHHPLPEAPVIRARCVNGEIVRIYTGHDGVEFEPMPTGESC